MPYSSNVYNFIDYAPRVYIIIDWKHLMCGDLRKYYLQISAIKAKIETAGLNEYKEADLYMRLSTLGWSLVSCDSSMRQPLSIA